jgi:hypothetical protein
VSPASIVTSVSEGLAKGFRGQPMLLALVLLNAAFLVAIFLSLRAERGERHLETKMLFERCLPEKHDAD